MPSAFCLLPSAFCLLPSAFCLLPAALCPLRSARCPLRSALWIRLKCLMRIQGVERREFQRLPLSSPIPAAFGGTEVRLVEAGILGARIEHDVPLPDPRAELQF